MPDDVTKNALSKHDRHAHFVGFMPCLRVTVFSGFAMPAGALNATNIGGAKLQIASCPGRGADLLSANANRVGRICEHFTGVTSVAVHKKASEFHRFRFPIKPTQALYSSDSA